MFGKGKDGQQNTRNLPVKALTGEEREEKRGKRGKKAPCRPAVAWEGVWGEEGWGWEQGQSQAGNGSEEDPRAEGHPGDIPGMGTALP